MQSINPSSLLFNIGKFSQLLMLLSAAAAAVFSCHSCCCCPAHNVAADQDEVKGREGRRREYPLPLTPSSPCICLFSISLLILFRRYALMYCVSLAGARESRRRRNRSMMKYCANLLMPLHHSDLKRTL